MKAVLFDQPGDADVLHLGEAPEPERRPGEVLIEVAATAVNRADVMQRLGYYPPPPGASSILGLEAAGRILALDDEGAARGLYVGQRVMALLAGGGYAERVSVPSGQVMPIPSGLSDEEAAAIPEVYLTAFLNLFVLGGLPFPGPNSPTRASQAASLSVLIHGGASGVGTAALSLLRAAGITAYCTVGAEERIPACQSLGAAATVCYRTTDFVEALLTETKGRGVDMILDVVGGAYLPRNLNLLAPDGRIVIIGLQGGTYGELDLGMLLRKRAQVIGSTLRALPVARKTALVSDFLTRVFPLFAAPGGPTLGHGNGPALRPIVDRVLPLSQAAEAHRALDGHHIGKIILRVAPAAAA